MPAEGSLLPETYHYGLGDARAELIERMQHAMARLVDELWPERDPTVALDDAAQAVVLASIVEKETAVADERPVIAGVFLNRLKQGMRLQADVTVVYAVTGGKAFPWGGRSRAPIFGSRAPTTLIARAACRRDPSPIPGGPRLPRF